jgi:hypothetical protein
MSVSSSIKPVRRITLKISLLLLGPKVRSADIPCYIDVDKYFEELRYFFIENHTEQINETYKDLFFVKLFDFSAYSKTPESITRLVFNAEVLCFDKNDLYISDIKDELVLKPECCDCTIELDGEEYEIYGRLPEIEVLESVDLLL